MSLDKISSLVNNESIEVATPLNDEPHGDSFAINEIFKTTEFIQLLEQRGLVFRNDYEKKRVEMMIDTVGYFTVSKYLKHFYSEGYQNRNLTGVQAKTLISAYRQNEALRRILIQFLLMIENRFRTLVSTKLIEYFQDPYWCYRKEFEFFQFIQEAEKKSLKRQESLHQPVKIFRYQYPTHIRLPAWVVLECQDFGTLTAFYQNKLFPTSVKKEIVKVLALEKPYNYSDLSHALNSLRSLRNMCVHNAKILGEPVRIAPPQVYLSLEATRLEQCLVWIQKLLVTITFRESFQNEIKQLCHSIKQTLPDAWHLKLPMDF